MPSPLRVTLMPEEERTLKELRIAKQRAVPRSRSGRICCYSMPPVGVPPEIAEIMNCHETYGKSSDKALGIGWIGWPMGKSRSWQKSPPGSLLTWRI